MSYDLLFWHDTESSSVENAAALYDKFTDGLTGVVAPDLRVGRFLSDVLSVYPEVEDEDDGDSPWASGVYSNAECVLAAVPWSRHAEVVPALIEIAQRNGMTTYDPQVEELHRPQGLGAPPRVIGRPVGSASPGPTLSLSSSNGDHAVDPSSERIADLVRRLSPHNWFVILERTSGEWVQIGYGEQAGTRAGWYALERRDGATSPQYRTVITDINEGIKAFQQFTDAGASWTKAFSWKELEL